MHDDFKVVRRKRQRKQKIQVDEESFSESLGTFNRVFEKAFEEFTTSRFCFELLQTIENSLKFISLNSISNILCYGIGHFLDSKSSLHQLAALLKIHKKYSSPVTIYDPVFTSLEIKALTDFKFEVLLHNEEGKRKISASQATLVFLPHCPKQLVNNFLWANWNISLCRCILIANSFSKIIQDNTHKVLQESANYILKIHQKTKEIPLEDCYSIENIFNDISVHYFRPEALDSNFFIATLEEEPVYLKETELIAKTFNKLTVKDG